MRTEVTGEIVTPDGVRLATRTYREDGYETTFADPVLYRGWEITYFPPDRESSLPPWHVSGDLRTPGSGMSEYNPDKAAPVEKAARRKGIEFETDHETSCSYFYLHSLADAKRLVDVIEEGRETTGTFTLEITLGNAGMEDGKDVAGALRRAAGDLFNGKRTGVIMDLNGNTVGVYTLGEATDG